MRRTEPRIDAVIFDLFGAIIAFDNDIVPTRIARHCADLFASPRGRRSLPVLTFR
jgi:hypothetical protein